MKFKFKGTIDDFVKKYSEARDSYNREHPNKSFALSAYLRGGKIEIGVEKGKNGGGYWFIAPIVEDNGYIELEGDIFADADMRMRWYDWISFAFIFIITLIPMLIACVFTKSTPFSSKKKREARLKSYLCDYMGCELVE